MSYSVNLYGHKDFESAEEVEAFEQEVIDKVSEFAAALPGLGGGTVNTSSHAQVVLQASDGAATQPDGSAVATEPETSGQEASELSTLSDEQLQAELARRKGEANPPA